jgi:hypothetical protein
MKADVMLNSLYLLREVGFASRCVFFATVKLITYIGFIIYTGKNKTEINQSTSTIEISGNVVMILFQPYFEKVCHMLIMDN